MAHPERPESLDAEVWRRFRAPRHAGRPDGLWAQGRGGALKTGGLIDVWLRVEDGCIGEARFESFGCPSTIAAGEWLCEWLEGRALGEASALDGLLIAEVLRLSAAKRGVALVAEDALKAALAQVRAPESSE